jgi:hypothetical protein
MLQDVQSDNCTFELRKRPWWEISSSVIELVPKRTSFIELWKKAACINIFIAIVNLVKIFLAHFITGNLATNLHYYHRDLEPMQKLHFGKFATTH